MVCGLVWHLFTGSKNLCLDNENWALVLCKKIDKIYQLHYKLHFYNYCFTRLETYLQHYTVYIAKYLIRTALTKITRIIYEITVYTSILILNHQCKSNLCPNLVPSIPTIGNSIYIHCQNKGLQGPCVKTKKKEYSVFHLWLLVFHYLRQGLPNFQWSFAAISKEYSQNL